MRWRDIYGDVGQGEVAKEGGVGGTGVIVR